MAALAAEFFTLDEVNRLKIIQDVIDRRLTTQMAAQRLGISDRQCRRLLSRYREHGPLGMANRRRGKPSNNQLPQGLRHVRAIVSPQRDHCLQRMRLMTAYVSMVNLSHFTAISSAFSG